MSVLNREGGPPRLRVIQAEQSLTKLKGSDLFEPQLDWLSELEEREEIDVLVLPATTIHAAMGRSFSILSFDSDTKNQMSSTRRTCSGPSMRPILNGSIKLVPYSQPRYRWSSG